MSPRAWGDWTAGQWVGSIRCLSPLHHFRWCFTLLHWLQLPSASSRQQRAHPPFSFPEIPWHWSIRGLQKAAWCANALWGHSGLKGMNAYGQMPLLPHRQFSDSFRGLLGKSFSDEQQLLQHWPNSEARACASFPSAPCWILTASVKFSEITS